MKNLSSVSSLGLLAVCLLFVGCASEQMHVRCYQPAIPFSNGGQPGQPVQMVQQTQPSQPNQPPSPNVVNVNNCSVAAPVSLITYSDDSVRKGFWAIPRAKVVIQQGGQQWQQPQQPYCQGGIQGAVGYQAIGGPCAQPGFYSPTAMSGGYGYSAGGGGGYGYGR